MCAFRPVILKTIAEPNDLTTPDLLSTHILTVGQSPTSAQVVLRLLLGGR